MNIKKFFSMDASTTARVLTVIARLGFILALAIVVIGFCLWFFSDDYSNKKFIGIFMMREFFPYIFGAWFAAGLAVLVKAASLYIAEKQPQDEEDDED